MQALAFLGKLLSKIPLYFYIIFALVIFCFVWGKWEFHAGAKFVKKRVEIQTKYVKVISPQITTKVVTEYVDRVKVVHEKGQEIVKKVPIYVTEKDNSQCVINNGFVQLWNAANKMQFSNSAGPTNEAPSGVVLTDIAAQHSKEAEYTHEIEAQLSSLQQWVREQNKLYNSSASNGQ